MNEKIIAKKGLKTEEFEKFVVLMQEIVGPIKIGKKIKIITEYDPDSPAVLFSYVIES